MNGPGYNARLWGVSKVERSSQAVLATWHICSKKSAHVGSTGSFSLLSTHQIDDVRVSCMKFTL